MKFFESLKAMGHEQVLFCHDHETNLKAIIALHDTSLGLAMGATRLLPYVSEEAALQDVLRLSRSMTYKAACANIPVGGAKAVIIAHPEDKTDAMLKSYARFVESLKGRFVTGQDVNFSPEDVRKIRQQTSYVVGIAETGGGPTLATAIGVTLAIKAAAEYRWQRQNLDGLRVAVQGLGNVGKHLCDFLYQNGVKLFVSDLNREKLEEVAELYKATIVEPQEIYSLDVDVFSPCALGGILNSSTIPQIQAPVIAGAANNQLEDEDLHSQMLESRNILYCPDYVINAGGLINVYNEMIGYDDVKAFSHVHKIYDTLLEIFHKADFEGITTYMASKLLGEERIQKQKTNSIYH
ncbi:MAG: tryptophan dehydrogenase ScyB [Mojavia pulchra JT2-VF2]|jgi:leucine dehydrogenase|uniref:Tryptophan dehydrogenase ScyB n=1 Tax=Mojavia pulchra JT2-VF2 TaxID=287848 RepID=A0A951Q2P2_9NOST|nr:tryptophan dehydrogenase ScyB [Mojavia pulchra JT2-VF2]